MIRRPIASTTQGPVRGRERGGVLLFAGIPYAAPPVGPRRFLPPQPHDGWSDVRDALRFGPAAPQRPGTGPTAVALAWDEDCLTLNVTTPATDDRARPVMVWIHGGAFRTGKGGIPWYDGTSFARRGDVVTVTINYRLGALGFANLASIGGDEVASSGLSGILDQIAALEWVRDNIARFGGDPTRVTIAGESAGAMSVGTLLGCPAAKGLFRRAIAQSGGAHDTQPAEATAEIGLLLARELRADSLEELRARGVDEVLDAQERVQARMLERHRRSPNGLAQMAFQPTVDGRVLPRAPIEAVRDGAASDVDLLCGTNRDETTLWGAGRYDEAKLARFAARYFGEGGADALATYRAGRPDAPLPDLSLAITTDHGFRIPAIRLCEAHGRAWQYLFTWRSRAFDGKLGATHALEIPFAFDNLGRPGVDAFLGSVERAQPLADAMHAAWTAFIRDGSPSCDALPEPWPRYAVPGRAVMELGDRIRVLHDPDGDERVLWDGIR